MMQRTFTRVKENNPNSCLHLTTRFFRGFWEGQKAGTLDTKPAWFEVAMKEKEKKKQLLKEGDKSTSKDHTKIGKVMRKHAQYEILKKISLLLPSGG